MTHGSQTLSFVQDALGRLTSQTDERGSVVSITDNSGATIAINAYDEYGIPASSNVGRFGYTGQVWLPELRMWYYKARIYSPTLGRFMQTDPIGYRDGMNWYNYVGSDPVNFGDPTGLEDCPPEIDSSGCSTAPCPGQWICLGGSDLDQFFLMHQINDMAGFASDLIGRAEDCLQGLSDANQSYEAVQRANAALATLSQVAQENGVNVRILAAIGVRESGFQNIKQMGGGPGRGVFQLTVPGLYTKEVADDLAASARAASTLLNENINGIYNNRPSLVDAHLTLPGALAAYNRGLSTIPDDPATYQVNTQNGDYATNVLMLTECF